MGKDRSNARGLDRLRDGLTVAEAAVLVGVHQNTVRNRIKAGTYKAEKVITKRGPTYLIERQSLLNGLATDAQPRRSQELANSQAAEFAQQLLSSFVADTVAARDQLLAERTCRESAERERDELRRELRQLRERLEERREPIKDATGTKGMHTFLLRGASHAAEAMKTVFRDKRSTFLLVGSLAIVLLVLLAPTVGPVRVAAEPQKMATPSYFYPGSLWTRMETTLPKQSTVIVNPSSGPGNAIDQNYAARVKRSRAANLTVLGYVYTDYGRRPSAVVKSDIDKYYSWYGVDGIFFDQASTDCSHARSYYKDLYGYVNGKDGTVVLNPGTQTNECYMAVADIVVNFEDTYANYASDSYLQPGWTSEYPATRFWHLVHTAATEAEMRDAVRLSRERNAGFVYVTPDTLPNPWDTLPVYWNDQLTALQAVT